MEVTQEKVTIYFAPFARSNLVSCLAVLWPCFLYPICLLASFSTVNKKGKWEGMFGTNFRIATMFIQFSSYPLHTMSLFNAEMLAGFIFCCTKSLTVAAKLLRLL